MATHCDRAPEREASSKAWELRAELENGCMLESKLLEKQLQRAGTNQD